jgi:uncharacterized membrane protein YhaH (DUF805 family)
MEDIPKKGSDEVYCSNCREIIKATVEICPECGAKQRSISPSKKNESAHYMDVIERCGVLFSGRAKRAELWWIIVYLNIINLLIGIISLLLFGDDNITLVWILIMILFVPYISIWWRRMHDVGKPGAYCFIPIYNFILAVRAGERGTNRYGPDPKVS